MSRIGRAAAIVSWGIAATATAQVNPELGEVGGSGGAQAQAGWGGQTPPAAPPAPGVVPYAGPVEPETPATGDHAAVVGHFGVGFFGVQSIPVMSCSNDLGCGGTSRDVTQSVSAPTIGVRYWLDPTLAIEAALGVGIASRSVETTDAGGTTPEPVESTTALALHGGVPIALAHGGHFVFEVVPQLNFGLAFGSLEDAGASAASWDLSGMLVEIGGRVGAEIHFGFIDIPQLALQGTLGLGLRIESRGAERTTPARQHDQSATLIGTSVGDEPWDIFTGGITAIYYFTD